MKLFSRQSSSKQSLFFSRGVVPTLHIHPQPPHTDNTPASVAMASGSGTHYTPKIKAALETMKEKLVGRLEVWGMRRRFQRLAPHSPHST